MPKPHEAGAHLSIKLPRSWAGLSFVCKFCIPVFFAAVILSAAIMMRNSTPMFLLYAAAVAAPFLLVGLFLFLVPVQLRMNDSGVALRRWYRWRFLRQAKVESVKTFSVLGRARISGERRRVIFFIERQNENLLRRGRRRNNR